MSQKTVELIPRDNRPINASKEDIQLALSVAYFSTLANIMWDFPSTEGLLSRYLNNMMNAERKEKTEKAFDALNQAFPAAADGKTFIGDFQDVYRKAYGDAFGEATFARMRKRNYLNYLPDFIADGIETHNVHKAMEGDPRVTDFQNRYNVDVKTPKVSVFAKRFEIKQTRYGGHAFFGR